MARKARVEHGRSYPSTPQMNLVDPPSDPSRSDGVDFSILSKNSVNRIVALQGHRLKGRSNYLEKAGMG